MILKVMAVLLASTVMLAAQSRAITINDDKGNQATATLNNGNLYYQDSRGNSASGTIRGGNVFINTSQGETIFGTIKSGNVFLTDPKGLTTGTIKNGNIFLSNSDGSTTTGTYNRFGSSTTTIPATPSGLDQTQQQQQQQQNQINQNNQNSYAAGYAAGTLVGSGIASGIGYAVQNHRMKQFCAAHPTERYIASGGHYEQVTMCSEATASPHEQEQIDAFCNEHPGDMGDYFEGRLLKCDVAPDSPSLKWIKWKMNSLRDTYQSNIHSHIQFGMDQIVEDFKQWQISYCQMAPGKSYNDLHYDKRKCE